MSVRVICPYCSRKAKLVAGSVVYPGLVKYVHRNYWRCDPCDAHVGTHINNPTIPLGRLANKALRKKRVETHKQFDWLWKSGNMSRSEAYEWMSKVLGTSKNRSHIGKIGIKDCDKICQAVENLMGESRI